MPDIQCPHCRSVLGLSITHAAPTVVVRLVKVPPAPAPTPVPAPPAPPPPVPPTPTPAPLPPAAVKIGVPIGPWHLPPEKYGTSAYNGAVLAGSSTMKAALERARLTKTSLILTFSRTKSKDATGELSVPACTAYLATWPDIASYLADGTVIGVNVCDDILGKDIWGPGAPYFDRIDLIAKAVTDRWPTALTFVRAKPTQLESFTWKHLKGAWAQYSAIARDGSPEAYRDTEVASAKKQGLLLIIGLNVLNGGAAPPAGTPKLSGPMKGRYMMDGAEITRYGKVFLPHTLAFLNWRYGPTYTDSIAAPATKEGVQGFDLRPDVVKAFTDLRKIADQTPRPA